MQFGGEEAKKASLCRVLKVPGKKKQASCRRGSAFGAFVLCTKGARWNAVEPVVHRLTLLKILAGKQQACAR